MKPVALIGILLTIVGVLILVFGGFSFTQERKAVDLGPLQVNVQERKSVPIAPMAGYACLIGGGILVFAGSRAGRA